MLQWQRVTDLSVLTNRRMLTGCCIIAAIVGICLLFAFNPETTCQYPRCPFYVLTGFKCPGCGTLRGLHALVHMRVCEAWNFNPAMVISIPIICACLVYPKLCKNVWFARIVCCAIVVWWVVRNMI